MSDSIGVYRNPYDNQYVAPQGYAFYKDGVYIGRVAWITEPNGYYIDKDK